MTDFATPVMTRMGLPLIWGADVERGWQFMRFNVFPLFNHALMPGSAGYGADRIPSVGGAVLASNHLSAVDGPLIGTFSRRAVWFMMKHELAAKPLVGEALMWTGGFPVNRDGCSPEGVQNARELVRTGHVVGVFPEGTRQRSGYPSAQIHAGAVAIAVKERVPIIPCGLETFGWSIRNRRACCVVYGEPMDFSHLPARPESYRRAAEQVWQAVHRLWLAASEAIDLQFPETLTDGTIRTRPTRLREFNRVGGPRRISGRPNPRWGKKTGVPSIVERSKHGDTRHLIWRVLTPRTSP